MILISLDFRNLPSQNKIRVGVHFFLIHEFAKCRNLFGPIGFKILEYAQAKC